MTSSLIPRHSNAHVLIGGCVVLNAEQTCNICYKVVTSVAVNLADETCLLANDNKLFFILIKVLSNSPMHF